MDEIRAAVDRFYKAFARHPKPARIDGCPCCFDRKDSLALLGRPLRDLSAGDLGPYAASAMSTVGTAADYLYFLPRILELTATGDLAYPDAEITARKIREAGLASWADERRAALGDYLDAVVVAAIRDADGDRIDRWICVAAGLGRPFEPYLDRVAADPAAVLSFFEVNAPALAKGRLSNSSWDQPSAAHDRVVAWFRSPAVAAIPFRAYGYRISPG